MEMIKTVLAGFGVAAMLLGGIKLIRKNGQTGEKPKIGTMNLVLIILGIASFLFILKMIQLYETYMAVPDTLITCFFAAVGGEAGILGWIKNTKTRNKEREWQLEDQERMKNEGDKKETQQTHF